MNKVFGVVIYRGWVMGLVDEMEEGLFGFIIWLVFGWMFGCVMLFYILGFNV